jgi:hypothetical protein
MNLAALRDDARFAHKADKKCSLQRRYFLILVGADGSNAAGSACRGTITKPEQEP